MLAVDAQVLALGARPLGDDQAPGQQRRGIAGPAVLQGQVVEVDIIAFQHDFLAGRAAYIAWAHIPERSLEHADLGKSIAQVAWRFGFAQRSQQFAGFTQRRHVFRAHAPCHALGRAEQIGQYRHGSLAAVVARIFEQ